MGFIRFKGWIFCFFKWYLFKRQAIYLKSLPFCFDLSVIQAVVNWAEAKLGLFAWVQWFLALSVPMMRWAKRMILVAFSASTRLFSQVLVCFCITFCYKLKKVWICPSVCMQVMEGRWWLFLKLAQLLLAGHFSILFLKPFKTVCNLQRFSCTAIHTSNGLILFSPLSSCPPFKKKKTALLCVSAAAQVSGDSDRQEVLGK